MTWTPLELALDELAAAVADTTETPAHRAALAAVVLELERAAGAALGGTATDPHVALVRRFARAHRLLLPGGHALDVDRVRAHVLTVRGAADQRGRPAGRTPAAARPRTTVEA